MDTIATLCHSRHASLFTSIAMACLWTFFASAHVVGFLHSGDWSYLLFCVAETLAAALAGQRLRQVLKSTWHMMLGALLHSLAGGAATIAEPPPPTGKLAYAFAIASGTGLQVFLHYTHLWSLR